MTFETLGLAPELLRAIQDEGYEIPSPIQCEAIPIVLNGHDMMAAAQTGTGKTAAFVLPLLQRLLRYANTSASPARHPIRALILTPTRELADQVFESVKRYGKYIPLRTLAVFGGVDMNSQIKPLREGVEILVATPGRLFDHLQQKTVSLSQIELLVLDEADRMLDMGFIQDIRRIIELLPKNRQTILFSATFSPAIKNLAETLLHEPQTVEVARQNMTSESITQFVHLVDTHNKPRVLKHLIQHHQMRQVIVFCKTKNSAEHLSKDLIRYGIAAEAIHGDRTQQARLASLVAFKEGRIQALVATDVAARGLDIEALPFVVNFELSPNAEDYVHRIGRTGRAGSEGVAITLVSPHEEKLLEHIRTLTQQALPLIAIEGFANTQSTLTTHTEKASQHTARPLRKATPISTREDSTPSALLGEAKRQTHTPFSSKTGKQLPALLLPPRK